MIRHSAQSTCSEMCACSQCFNNLVDPRGFTIMLTPKCASQSIVEAYLATKPRRMRFSSKSFVERKCTQHFILGMIRNPFSRLVSCWMDKCVNKPGHRTWQLYGMAGGMTFEAFARAACEVPHAEADKHWRSMSFDMFTDAGEAIPDEFVRIENLDAEWEAATKRLYAATRIQLPALPHNHASGHKPYREYYTPALVELVGDYYHDDLVNFNYSFDEQPDLHAVAAAV